MKITLLYFSRSFHSLSGWFKKKKTAKALSNKNVRERNKECKKITDARATHTQQQSYLPTFAFTQFRRDERRSLFCLWRCFFLCRERKVGNQMEWQQLSVKITNKIWNRSISLPAWKNPVDKCTNICLLSLVYRLGGEGKISLPVFLSE